MRYFLIAGEASGDLHGSNLMRGLYAEDKDAVIRFWGGDLMHSVFRENNISSEPDAGLAHDYKEGAIMGISEVLLKARKLLGNIDSCKKDIENFKPDVVILIDYPGFNLRIAKWAYNNGFKVFYYIAPKVWASREKRIRSLKAYIHEMFIVFPFEKTYFDRKGLKYHYYGNPLVDAVANSNAMSTPIAELKESLGFSADTHVIAMLAGSRKGEVQTMLPMLRRTAEILHADPRYKDFKFVVAGAPGRKLSDYAKLQGSGIEVIFGKTQEIVRCADAAVINSGTASLEAVLLNTPQVVAYRFPSRITNLVAPLIVKIKYISLGNLCLDRLAFKEYFKSSNCTGEMVSAELDRIISDADYRTQMLADYDQIRKMLGNDGASRKVAAKMIDLLKTK